MSKYFRRRFNDSTIKRSGVAEKDVDTSNIPLNRPSNYLSKPTAETDSFLVDGKRPRGYSNYRREKRMLGATSRIMIQNTFPDGMAKSDPSSELRTSMETGLITQDVSEAEKDAMRQSVASNELTNNLIAALQNLSRLPAILPAGPVGPAGPPGAPGVPGIAVPAVGAGLGGAPLPLPVPLPVPSPSPSPSPSALLDPAEDAKIEATLNDLKSGMMGVDVNALVDLIAIKYSGGVSKQDIRDLINAGKGEIFLNQLRASAIDLPAIDAELLTLPALSPSSVSTTPSIKALMDIYKDPLFPTKKIKKYDKKSSDFLTDIVNKTYDKDFWSTTRGMTVKDFSDQNIIQPFFSTFPKPPNSSPELQIDWLKMKYITEYMKIKKTLPTNADIRKIGNLKTEKGIQDNIDKLKVKT